jgi:predicted HTH transcriptional regulator
VIGEGRTNGIIKRLLGGSGESECVEFKHNNGNPHRIGEYISALANSAARHGQWKI